jgi:hypothetical protein
MAKQCLQARPCGYFYSNCLNNKISVLNEMRNLYRFAVAPAATSYALKALYNRV